MQLALKRTPASNATRWQRTFAALTKWRLCSNYSHGGIVIDGRLFHATATNGLTSQPFDIAAASAGWDFVDLGQGNDAAVKALFEQRQGTKYDWFGLLAFVLPWRADDSLLYCFEFCALAMGLPINGRVTPEMLLRAALDKKG